MDLKQYEYLWTNPNYDYVLVKTTLGYLIVNRVTDGVLLMENEKLAREIEEKMLQKGVPIFESSKHLQDNCESINVVGQPTQADDFPEKRYKVFIEWAKDKSLVAQVKELKKVFSVVNDQSNQELLGIARSSKRWQFDTLYLFEEQKQELINRAKEHGLKICFEIDELREWY